jgi:hypothetical protein
MESRPVEASFTPFELPCTLEPRDATVAIPVSNGVQQRYFFMNMRTRKGMMVKYPARDSLLGLDVARYLEHLCTFAMNPNDWFFPRLRVPFRKFHNGISFLEVLFKVLKPHGVTYLGQNKFMASLWSASIYFVIDLKLQKATMHMEDCARRDVFSTYQYCDVETQDIYYATQRGVDELYKHLAEAIHFDVPIRIKKHNMTTGKTEELWAGDFDTDTHYIMLNKDKRYLSLVNFGDFYDEQHKLIPSKIIVLDLKEKKHWMIDNTGWAPSAHVDWDPVCPNTAYYSCHNGAVGPQKSPWYFLRKKQYHWDIFGPASVHKYVMTDCGPEKVGIFTHPEMERLTIHKVFMHRGKKLLACTGFPDNLFYADADTMEFVRQVKIKAPCGMCCGPTPKPAVLGSLFPSPDGEKMYLSTTADGKGYFQVLDVETDHVDLTHPLGKVWDPFNHMTSVCDACW